MARTVELEVPCPRAGCGSTLLIEAEVDPGEANWGSDADGNRGIDIPPSIQVPEWDGETCEQAHTYTDEEVAELNASLKQAAEDYRYEPSDPYDY